MTFKIVILAGLMVACHASVVPHLVILTPVAPAPAPAAKTPVDSVDADYDSNPKYSFKYDVNEPMTGDIKSQQESRDGDVVKGRYSLMESDGSTRTVEYNADKNGFNAIIKNDKPVMMAEAAPAPATPAPATPAQHPILLAKIAHIPYVIQQYPTIDSNAQYFVESEPKSW